MYIYMSYLINNNNNNNNHKLFLSELNITLFALLS